MQVGAKRRSRGGGDAGYRVSDTGCGIISGILFPTEKTQSVRLINSFPAAVDTELLVDIDRVSFDRFGRDEKLLSDLFVAHPLSQQVNDFEFSVCQRLNQGLVR